MEEAIKAQARGSWYGQCWSLDALFATPNLLNLLPGADVGYVVGLKANQSELLAQAQGLRQQRVVFDWSPCEKGHGRVEDRHYQGYELPLWHLQERWSKTGLQTVVWVDRSRYRTKDGQTTQASCCFVRNRSLIGLGGQELAGAIRNHWRIESIGSPCTGHDRWGGCFALWTLNSDAEFSQCVECGGEPVARN